VSLCALAKSGSTQVKRAQSRSHTNGFDFALLHPWTVERMPSGGGCAPVLSSRSVLGAGSSTRNSLHSPVTNLASYLRPALVSGAPRVAVVRQV